MLYRYIFIGVLLSVTLCSWYYAVTSYISNREAIHSQIQEIKDMLLLPYYMQELAREEPDSVLVMPVFGVRVSEVTDTWGGVRSGGRQHEGVDIFAQPGAPVYSATQGYVLRITERGLGGKFVFILGKGGRRYYYAHLYAHSPYLKAGSKVSTTTILGFVGNTGNASGTSPHLHFGMYTNQGAQNPYQLLNDRE